jgi:hypothetical protein
MKAHGTLSDAAATETLFSGAEWFDPIEGPSQGCVHVKLEQTRCAIGTRGHRLADR